MTWIKATKTLLAKLCHWIPDPQDLHRMYHKSNKSSCPDCPPESDAGFPFLDLEFFWTPARRECISTGKERKFPRNKVILLKTCWNFLLEMPFPCFELQDFCRGSADFGNIGSVAIFFISEFWWTKCVIHKSDFKPKCPCSTQINSGHCGYHKH